jgi:hypothetical protein
MESLIDDLLALTAAVQDGDGNDIPTSLSNTVESEPSSLKPSSGELNDYHVSVDPPCVIIDDDSDDSGPLLEVMFTQSSNDG